MSILKRKAASLDPVQKQRKFRQTQYYALLDKCLQIPNDDKLILRKNIEDQQERLLSLLEKYRKEGTKDLKDLQIFLRKYVQKYKLQNPKYPTLKLTKSTQSFSILKKRNSFSFSMNRSKMTVDLGVSNSQTKNGIAIPCRNLASYQIQNIKQKPGLRLNTHMSRDEQKNYEELIRKRKTQKLKISQHKVSITIDNESQTTTFYKDILNCHAQDNETKKTLNDSKHNNLKVPTQQIDDQKIEKAQFLETLRFRMKIDEPEQQNQEVISSVNIIPIGTNSISPMLIDDPLIFLKKFQCQKQIKDQDQQFFQSVQRKIFIKNQDRLSINTSKYNASNNHQTQLQRKPLRQINFDNTFSSIKKLKDLNVSKAFNQNIQDSFEVNQPRENFNSGQNSQDYTLKQLFSKNQEEIWLQKSQLPSQSKVSVTTRNKQNQVHSQYLKSQKKLSDIYSHRLLDESKSLIGSFCKEKDDHKQSRMIFSHRMQEVISGRTNENSIQEKSETNYEKSPSHFFRDNKKGASKLQFWARIQSTINE